MVLLFCRFAAHLPAAVSRSLAAVTEAASIHYGIDTRVTRLMMYCCFGSDRKLLTCRTIHYPVGKGYRRV